jgi:hypothetical protein
LRFFVGEVCDAYLVRSDIQRGMTIVVWRGRHVAEPTELTEAEAAPDPPPMPEARLLADVDLLRARLSEGRARPCGTT